MENEYSFNYDEVKRRFESVSQTNSIITYKTYFQPRTKSIIGKNNVNSNIYPLITNKIQRQQTLSSSKITFKVNLIHVKQIMPIEQFNLQTQQRFYRMSNLIK